MEKHTHTHIGRKCCLLTDIQIDKLPIRAAVVHKTKGVSTSRRPSQARTVERMNIEKPKTSKFLLLHLKMAGVAGAGVHIWSVLLSPYIRLDTIVPLYPVVIT